MRIALAQINSGPSMQENIAKVSDYVRESAHKDADLVVFPEATMCAFGNDLFEAAAESQTWRTALSQLAQEHDITIIAGEFEQAGKRVRNLAGIYSPDGSREDYAKIHLFDAFGFSESETVEPGNDLVTAKIGNVTVGLAICYDIRFPKLFAELSRAGAQVILVPTSWGKGPAKEEQWKVLSRARALDSNTFVVAVDQADPATLNKDINTDAPRGIGYSTVTDPFGHTLIELGTGEDLKVITLDLEQVEKARRALPVLETAKLGY